MPRPSSDIQWPESSSDDDFVPRKEFRGSDGKATKPTVTTTQVSRSKKQKRSPKATLSNAPLSKKPLNHSFERCDDEDIVSTIASEKANAISLPPGIRSSSDLKWWYEDNRYYPCRICDSAEAMYINLDPVWDTTELALIQVLEFPPTKPFKGRDRILANLCDLKACGTSGDTWDMAIWKKYNSQRAADARRANQRVLSETDVRAGYLYLNRILKAAKEKDSIPEPRIADGAEEADENSDLETPYEVNLKLNTTGTLHPYGRGMPDFSDKIHEPLRPGDIIQYSTPIFCAGDPRGLRTATVLSTDPSSTGYMIRLDNTEMLPNEHMVKRIKVIEQGKLYAHEGFYRPINRFALKKRALDMDMRQPFLRQSDLVGKIVDKHVDKFRKSMKDKGLPIDLVHDFKSRRKLKADEQLELAKERKSASKKSRKQVEPTFDSQKQEHDEHTGRAFEAKANSKTLVSTMQESSSSDSDDSLEIATIVKKAAIKAKNVASSDSLLDESDVSLTATRPMRHDAATSSTSSNKFESKGVPMHCSPSQASSRNVLSGIVKALLNEDSVSLKRKPNPMIHDESDSESSMENYGLDTAAKAKQESKHDRLDEAIPDQGLNIRRNKKVSCENGRPQPEPATLVNMDQKDGRILTSRRLYTSAEIVKPAFGLTKVNSSADRPSKNHSTKLSVRAQDAPTPRRKKVQCAETSLDPSEMGERRSVDQPVVEHRSTQLPTEKREHSKDKRFKRLHRIRRNGRYIAEEDDIEDSDDDLRSRRTPTSTKCGTYQPLVRLPPCTKQKDLSSLESY